MKTIKKICTILLVSAVSAVSTAQTSTGQQKTETIKVSGNCDMCKTRIEKAVMDEGASSANWDQKTKILALTFDPSKTNLDALEKKIAAVGHDNEKYRADDKAYDALPACCKYDRTPVKMQAFYTCPMHPEIHSDVPGKCPKCGMTLIKKDASKPVESKTQHDMESIHKN